VKLRRVPAGQTVGYATLDGRYLIERQDGSTECSHPLCDTLHRDLHPGDDMHWVSYVAWHVWDTVRDDYAGHEQFDTKRDAVAWLERHLGELS
jgi:hypothetical protein